MHLTMYESPTDGPFFRSTARWKHLLTASFALVFTYNGSAAAINWYSPNTNYSIARNWSERALESIRMDTPHPPAQARNLFSYSVCMYDAWAAYDSNAVGFVYRGKHTASDVAAARREAISYAMHRMMVERLAYSRTATNQAVRNPDFMTAMGYDPNNTSRDISTPAGVGNSVYDAVSAWFLNDGSLPDQRHALSNGQPSRGLSGLSRWQSTALPVCQSADESVPARDQ